MRKIEFTKEWLRVNKIAIRCENQNEANSVFLLFSGHDCDWTPENTCFYPDNACGAIFFREVDCESDGLSIILYSDVAKDSRKIIGYKVPFDMVIWELEKGEVIRVSDKDIKLNIYPIYTQSHAYLAPSEIVETWEPVYEEVKAVFGDYDDIFKYFKGYKIIFKEGEPITIYDTDVLVGTGRTHFVLNKQDYDFTPEFEAKLKEIGINV